MASFLYVSTDHKFISYSDAELLEKVWRRCARHERLLHLQAPACILEEERRMVTEALVALLHRDPRFRALEAEDLRRFAREEEAPRRLSGRRRAARPRSGAPR